MSKIAVTVIGDHLVVTQTGEDGLVKTISLSKADAVDIYMAYKV